MKTESIKFFVTAAGAALTLLGFSWRTGAVLSGIQSNVIELTEFKTRQIVRNEQVTDKLARVETMVEMMVKSMGLQPPPKQHD